MMRQASGDVGAPDSTASNPDSQEPIAELDGTYSVEPLVGGAGVRRSSTVVEDRMASRLLLAVGITALMTAGARADPGGEEMKKLEGAWVVHSATRDGKTLNHLKDGQMVFAGDKLTIKPAAGDDETVTYKVDPSQKPKRMDLDPENKKLTADLGKAIYELNGDTLKLCLGPPDKRPTEFTDKDRALIMLKRKK
jgi:uncharacterized protein (TIGR03067 family)